MQLADSKFHVFRQCFLEKKCPTIREVVVFLVIEINEMLQKFHSLVNWNLGITHLDGRSMWFTL